MTHVKLECWNNLTFIWYKIQGISRDLLSGNNNFTFANLIRISFSFRHVANQTWHEKKNLQWVVIHVFINQQSVQTTSTVYEIFILDLLLSFSLVEQLGNIQLQTVSEFVKNTPSRPLFFSFTPILFLLPSSHFVQCRFCFVLLP